VPAMLTRRPRLSNTVRIAVPSGPVVRATAAMASATASSAGAAATASWFESPRQIRPRREIASFVRSIWRASWSETTTPKSRASLGVSSHQVVHRSERGEAVACGVWS
jgi:hypothetical protein